MLDPMQHVYDGSEAAQDALHNQEGIEMALRATLAGVLTGPQEQVVWALVECIARYRCEAEDEIRRLQAVSMGKAH